MLEFLNLSTTQKSLKTAGITTDTGTAQGQGALASFGALLTQAANAGAENGTEAGGKLSQLAAMLGKFRTEAQESLAEVFPDGVITPGPQFDAWAQSMLTRLDGMLTEAGLDLAQVTQMLGSLDTLVDRLIGGEGGAMLAQAARTLVAGVGSETPVAATPVTVEQVAEAIEGIDAPDAATLSEALDLPDEPELRALIADLAKGQGGTTTEATGGAPDAAMLALGTEPQLAGDAEPANPLPDALKLLLAQVVAAPADRALPPDMQTLLNAPQPTAAPIISNIAATAPAQAPQQPASAPASNGFARNLAGQIRGVSFTEGTTRIELTPHGLGKMEIEIAADEAGKLRVVVRAENPSVLNAMRNDREMLVGLLRDGGTSVDDSAMSFEDLGQGRQPTAQNSAGQLATSAPLTADDEDDTPAAPVAEDGRLNILT